MKGKKTIASVLTSLMVAGILFVAPVTVVKAKAKAADPVKINVWAHWMSAQRLPTITAMINQFNKENEGKIVATYTGVPFSDINTKFASAVAAGDPPDAIVQAIESVSINAQNGLIEDITKYLPKSIRYQYTTGSWATVTYNNKIYALPFNTDTRLVFYNKDLFAKAGITKFPTSWDQMFKIADKLDKKDSSGKYTTVSFIPTMGNFGFDTILFANGGKKFKDVLNPMDPTYDSKKVVQTLTFMQNWVKRYGQTTYNTFEAMSSGGTQDPFITGKVAMIGQVCNYIATLQKYAPTMNYGVAPLPKGPSALNIGAAGGGFVWEVGKGTKHPAEAAKFVQFITGKWASTKWLLEQKDVMCNIAANSPTELANDDRWAAVKNMLKYTTVSRRNIYAPDFGVADNPMIDGVVKNGKDPAAMAKQAQDTMLKVIKDNKAMYN